MRSSFLLFITLVSGSLAAPDCHADNCANHVTGTFAGIGVPVESRIAMCNRFLKTTIKPAATTVTSTITKYTTRVPEAKSSTIMIANGTATVRRNQTMASTVMPTFAVAECPERGQFSSACNCWNKVKATTTTLPRSTVTATSTVYLNVACSPASTEVCKKTRFPCSREWGRCSCLKSGGDDVCVRVASLFGGGHGGNHMERNVTGPCEAARECNAEGGCDDPGTMCIYDDSCKCGKRRCYKAAPNGCEYQDLPRHPQL